MIAYRREARSVLRKLGTRLREVRSSMANMDLRGTVALRKRWWAREARCLWVIDGTCWEGHSPVVFVG